MGGSCSSELAAEKKKTKQLEARIKLYEAGITDSSLHEMHSSQTNIGLLNVATENNTNGCDCSSSLLWGVLEMLALLVVCILLLYIAYNCLADLEIVHFVSYNLHVRSNSFCENVVFSKH